MSALFEAGLTFSTFGMLIVAARRSIRQLIAVKVVPLNITPHHYWMLMIIFKGAPLPLGELARAMWMDAPTVSRMVREMGLRGNLTVGPDPAHGRRIRIRMTPEGEDLCEKLVKIDDDFHENSQKGMTIEEMATLREGLSKLIRNLDVMVATELPGMPIRPRHNEEPTKELAREQSGGGITAIAGG
jgi:DNA-binding MarR family transcriptional regulator